jgi:hypothetical protein
MYEKITYSGTECNNYIYFSFNSEYFDTEIISKTLKIEPTSVRLKKEPVPKSTSWEFRIDVGGDIDLEKPLHDLIEIFEPKIIQINELKENLNLSTIIYFVIDIDINPNASTPYFGLDNRAIEFLFKTKTEVHYDLYKADTIGLLEE